MYDFKVKSSSLNCVIGSSESFSDGLETVKRERERERERDCFEEEKRVES